MQSIPIQRLILYLVLIGFLPVTYAFYSISSTSKEIDKTQQLLESTRETMLIYESNQGANLAVIEHYDDYDRFYIDKSVESIQLLQPEIEALQKIQRQGDYIENREVKTRLDFLLNKNRLKFLEGNVQSNPYFNETLESLVSPVEANSEDVEKILARIEGVRIGPYEPGPKRPQLIITDFKLNKKVFPTDNEVFSLNLKFIKREYN